PPSDPSAVPAVEIPPRRRPRPAAVAVAVPVAPEVGVVGEPVVALRADSVEAAHRLAALPQRVRQPGLLVGQLDEVEAGHAGRVEGDAELERPRAVVDPE